MGHSEISKPHKFAYREIYDSQPKGPNYCLVSECERCQTQNPHTTEVHATIRARIPEKLLNKSLLSNYFIYLFEIKTFD